MYSSVYKIVTSVYSPGLYTGALIKGRSNICYPKPPLFLMRECIVTRAQSIQVYVPSEHLNIFLWLSNGFPLNLVF